MAWKCFCTTAKSAVLFHSAAIAAGMYWDALTEGNDVFENSELMDGFNEAFTYLRDTTLRDFLIPRQAGATDEENNERWKDYFATEIIFFVSPPFFRFHRDRLRAKF